MNYTSIEQSKKLLELGLSAESADMCYLVIAEDEYSQYPVVEDKDDMLKELPCWSLGALMEMIPYYSVIAYTSESSIIDITYTANPVIHMTHREIGDSPIEAAYNMGVWLLVNGYIKKGE